MKINGAEKNLIAPNTWKIISKRSNIDWLTYEKKVSCN